MLHDSVDYWFLQNHMLGITGQQKVQRKWLDLIGDLYFLSFEYVLHIENVNKNFNTKYLLGTSTPA